MKLHRCYSGQQLFITEGYLGRSCGSETRDLLTANQYVLVRCFVFITLFAANPNNVPHLLKAEAIC